MAEIYNIRDIKVAITKILYTPNGNRFRLYNNFVPTSIQECKYVFVIYSGLQRFIEVGFSDPGVYKFLRFMFKIKSINQMILKVMEFFNAIRTN